MQNDKIKQPGIVICSRLNSRRILNKPLQKINGIPIIQLLVERLLKGEIPICVALPVGAENDVIFDVIHDYPIEFYHGSENNVLDRFYMAARINDYDPIVRVTHDDILIDTDMMMDMIDYHKLQHADYTFVRDCIEGTGVEVVNMSVVEKALPNYKKIEHLSYAFKKYADKIVEYHLSLHNET